MDSDDIKRLNTQANCSILSYFNRKRYSKDVITIPSMLPVTPFIKENPYKYKLDNSCLVKATMSGIMGYVIGGFFGIFMSSMRADTSVHSSQSIPNYSLKDLYREFKSNAKSTARNFGQFGFLLVGTECLIEKYRGKHDITNEILAGVIVGTLGGLRASPKLALFGGLSLGTFSGIVGVFLASH